MKRTNLKKKLTVLWIETTDEKRVNETKESAKFFMNKLLFGVFKCCFFLFNINNSVYRNRNERQVNFCCRKWEVHGKLLGIHFCVEISLLLFIFCSSIEFTAN